MRYVLALFFALGFVFLVGETMKPEVNVFFTGLSWLSMLLTAASLFYVFRADAGAGLRGEA